MSGFSDFLEDELLDHVFEGTLYANNPDKYIALCTVAVTDTNTGSTITEPTDAAYARKVMATWDVSSGGATENTNPITFNQATASWGTILDFAICDAITVGNVLCYGSLTISKSVASGDTPKFATGDLDITLT